ncbi:MAG: 50S ribosomal protein L19e [Candidatus Parvarchaeota archaeon]|jgi:large subunit ribosomal protein L19e|nr:50S ribosomal protein L19e [Candidatus Parvarchaeota archaeon]
MKGMIKTQRRLASDILGVGQNRVWMDNSKFKEIKEAITRSDVENLIVKGVITRKEVAGQSRARARLFHLKKKKGHRKGPGSRKGKKAARAKFVWKDRVRALRKELFKQRAMGKIDHTLFRVVYKRIKGNAFHSVAHMQNTIEEMKKT